MRKTVLASTIGAALVAAPMLASAQTASPSPAGDPAILAMKLEEANFLLDQRRQQLEQANQTILTLNQEKKQTADYWTAYMKGLKPEVATGSTSSEKAPSVPASAESTTPPK